MNLSRAKAAFFVVTEFVAFWSRTAYTKVLAKAKSEGSPNEIRVVIYGLLFVLAGVTGTYMVKFNEAGEKMSALTDGMADVVSKTYFLSCMKSNIELNMAAELAGKRTLDLTIPELSEYCHQRSVEVYNEYVLHFAREGLTSH